MSDHPDYRRKFHPGDPVGPSSQELERNRRANFDARFNGPYGFKEQKFKRGFIRRHPKLFTGVFVVTYLGLYFHKFIYDAFLRQPSPEEIYVAELRKQRWIENGFWDNPVGYYINLRKERKARAAEEAAKKAESN